MTGPREWRHADRCELIDSLYDGELGCTCGLSAVRDAIASGHRVVIGPDGVEGRVVVVPGTLDHNWVVPLEVEP